MKKFTKRLTMIVAVLLSLVLLSSSIVSTTLAKYVVTKDVTSTVGLQAFGLEVELKVDSKISHTKSSKGDSAEITINNFKLKPGDDFKNAITASITGKPSVDANVTIAVSVTCDDTKFKIDTTNFNALSLGKDKLYTPVGFYVNGTSKVSSYYNCDYVSGTTTTLGTYITEQLADQIHTNVDTKISGKAISGGTISGKILSTIANPVSITNIGIGFSWIETDADKTNGNYEIGTWIAKGEPTYTITYKITVSQ